MKSVENIPAELWALPRWMPRQNGHVIYEWKGDARAKNCATLDALLASYRKGDKSWQGYDIWIEPQDGYVLIDIDDCIADAKYAPEVVEIFSQIGKTYAEISQSGHGLHLVYRGSLPEDFKHEKPKDLPKDKFCFPWDIEIRAGHPKSGSGWLNLTGNTGSETIPINAGNLEALLAKCKAALPAPETAYGVAPAQQEKKELVITRASDYRLEAIEWLWPGKIPLRHSTLFSGHTSVGKSLCWADVVARVTQFRDFPDAKLPEGIGGEVLILAQEDDYNEVLCPRLVAAGARMDSVFFINGINCSSESTRSERMFTFEEDMAELERLFAQEGELCQLVVIDPISDYFGKGKSLKEKQDVSAIFNRLNELARKYDLANITVDHFNKQSGQTAKHRTGGSVAMTTKPRAAWAFSELPEEEVSEGKGDHAMTWIKGNLGRKPHGLRYSITTKPLRVWSKSKQEWIEADIPHIVWHGEESRTTDELLAEETERMQSGGGRKRDKCIEWIKGVLAHGERLSMEVYQEGAPLGFSHDTILRAYHDAGFPEPIKRTNGRYYMQPLTAQPVTDESPF